MHTTTLRNNKRTTIWKISHAGYFIKCFSLESNHRIIFPIYFLQKMTNLEDIICGGDETRTTDISSKNSSFLFEINQKNSMMGRMRT